MKLIVKKGEVKILDEYGVSKFSEYNLPFNTFSTGVSEITGRYPNNGFDVDEGLEATCYVVSGSGKIWLDDQIYDIAEGDMVFVPKGKKYWINGNNLKLVVISSPPWTPEQHKHLNE